MLVIQTFLALLTFISVVNGAPSVGSSTVKRMTNGERLARGLPPMSPIKRGVNARAGTPVARWGGRASPSPSPRPSVTYTGRIEVKSKQGGNSYGFVENSQSGVNGVNFGGPIPELHVVLTTSGHGPYDIVATNPNFAAPFFVGGDVGGNPGILGIGRGDFAALANVNQTRAGESGNAQSAVWTISPSTSQLKAHWVNTDGSKPRTFIGFDIRNNHLVLTGDIDGYNKQAAFPVSEVNFFLVDF